MQLFGWWRREQDSEERRGIYASAQHYTPTRDCFDIWPPSDLMHQQEHRRAHMLNFTVRPSLSGYVHNVKLMAQCFLLFSLISSFHIHSSCISNYTLHNYSLLVFDHKKQFDGNVYLNVNVNDSKNTHQCSIYDKFNAVLTVHSKIHAACYECPTPLWFLSAFWAILDYFQGGL